ncbi:neural cell adhesion molecule 1 [Elysia marginata]|uniref:Neural cell adhesion molecule 1 n=1 Tax=Elysia marginata TaxID=1093978 RepID=A0AAV4I5Q6_9GAST|nr:neural cell adhesion molecule 1 [Elysia marginata]
MNSITQYKKERQPADSEDSRVPDKLNEFFARLDRENTSTHVPLQCDNHDPTFLVTEQETRRALTRLDVNKAAGPDNIKPRLLKTCSNQLASIFTFFHLVSCYINHTDVFQTVNNRAVPKKPSTETLNDYGPVTLTSGGNLVEITETPVYSHTPIPATATTPVYYSSQCSVRVSVEELGEGTHSFVGYIYPDVTGGKNMMNGSPADKDVTLSFPQVSHSCLTNMEQGYFIGKSARCTCRATSDGYPRGSAQWYKGDQPVGTNGDLDITYNKNNPEQVYKCEAKSKLGRKPGSTLRAKFAYVPEVTFTKSSLSTEFNKGDNLDLTCSAQGNPDPTSVILTRERNDDIINHTLFSLDCLDTGVYVCSGQNSQGTTSKEIRISVNCAQQFSPLFSPSPKVDGVLGETAEVDIEIYGFPEPRVTLHRNVDNADLTSSPRHEVKYTSTVAPFGFVNVTISDLVEADYTNYTLTIDNGVGDALVYSFYLNQVDQTKPEAGRDTDTEGDPFNTTALIVGLVAVVILGIFFAIIVFLVRKIQDMKGRLDNYKENTGTYMVPVERPDIVNTLQTTETPRSGHYEDIDGVHNTTHAPPVSTRSPPLSRQDQNITQTSADIHTTLVSASRPPGNA